MLIFIALIIMHVVRPSVHKEILRVSGCYYYGGIKFNIKSRSLIYKNITYKIGNIQRFKDSIGFTTNLDLYYNLKQDGLVIRDISPQDGLIILFGFDRDRTYIPIFSLDRKTQIDFVKKPCEN